MLRSEGEQMLAIALVVALVLFAIYYIVRTTRKEGYGYTYPYDFLEPARRFCGRQQRLYVPYTDEEVFVRYH